LGHLEPGQAGKPNVEYNHFWAKVTSFLNCFRAIRRLTNDLPSLPSLYLEGDEAAPCREVIHYQDSDLTFLHPDLLTKD